MIRVAPSESITLDFGEFRFEQIGFDITNAGVGGNCE